MNKLLIIGGTSLLGSQLIRDLSKENDITATYHTNKIKSQSKVNKVYLNITNPDNIKSVINRKRWDFILHTASVGDVDYCERNKELAWRVNTVATAIIAKNALKTGSRLIYFSTNAVYDGRKGMYTELSKPNPINYYGKTKLEGERMVKKSGVDYVILRLNTMYGWNEEGQRQNPAVWIIKSLKKENRISVVNDVYNTHLWVGFVSKIIKKLHSFWPNKQTFNIGGAECLNRYNFALAIGQVFKLNSSLITEVGSDKFLSLAPRPKNTCFITSKMQKKLSIKPLTLIEGLELMKKQKKR